MTTPRMTSRPVKLTRVCWGVAALVVVVFTAIARLLGGGPEGKAQFRLGDQIAMVVLGVLIAAAVLSLTRARVSADAEGVRVRNVVGERLFPWQVVSGVRLDDGASWASLDLQDDDTVGLLGIQANDGERAVDAVLALRRLLADSRRAT